MTEPRTAAHYCPPGECSHCDRDRLVAASLDRDRLRDAAQRVSDLLDNALIAWGKYPELDKAHDDLSGVLSSEETT